MSKITPVEFLSSWPEEASQMALRLRDLVLEVCPEVEERVYLGWRIVGFSLKPHPTWDMVCYIGFSKGKLALGFNQGVLLPDPQMVLQGKAKHARNLYLKLGEPIPEATVRDLLTSAYGYALFQLEGM
jgi:hypothetical protein